VYNGGIVNIQLQVRSGRSILDSDKFINALVESGVDSGLILKLVDKYTKMSAAAHVFTTTLNIEN
jgi:hypothetical protein